MDSIYKTFFGKTIDLSKVIAISDAEMYCPDGYTAKVGFHIDVELRDEPIVFQRELKASRNYDEVIINDGDEAALEWRRGNSYFQILILFDDGDKVEPNGMRLKGEEKCIAVKNLQSQIDNLISVWREYKSKS